MTCREFTKQIEVFTPAELSHAADTGLLAHQRECAACSEWLQRRQVLVGAMQVLRSSTVTMEAPIEVERNVLRAFRQSAAGRPAAELQSLPHPLAFRRSRFFEWGAYAAVAAALAVCLGLGLWFLQHSGKTTKVPSPTVAAEKPSESNQAQPEKIAKVPDVPTPASTRRALHTSTKAIATSQPKPVASSPSLIQMAQAQGYTPLMLCDPLSCSGDEQVVRLELPATGADGSTQSQMADVIVGDDGLVRAIRIVQQ